MRERSEITPPIPVVFVRLSGLTVHQLVQDLLLTCRSLVCGEKGGGEAGSQIAQAGPELFFLQLLHEC